MKFGMVGLPNAGKSTLFNAFMKKAQAHADNFPFCTIEPNSGFVPIPDQRLDNLAKIVNPEQIVPTTLECVDIAGLIKGAATGAGLGNKFLANIRNVDLILQVVRAFADPATNEDPTPAEDIDIINIELALSDMEVLNKYAEKNKRDKIAAGRALSLVKKMEEGQVLRDMDLSDDDLALIKQLGLLTIKPVIYVFNVGEKNINYPHPYFFELAKDHDVVKCCAKLEFELSDMSEDDRNMMLEEYGVEEEGKNIILQKAYKSLNLLSYFTAGEKEVRAWQVKRGSKAPQAAGVIHGDFERGFICAETLSYDDFIEYDGWEKGKAAGKLRKEGKAYEVKDGDVFLFRYNV